MYIYINLSTPTGTRSDDQLDQHPPIYSEVSNDPVIKQSDDMNMSCNAAYMNNSTCGSSQKNILFDGIWWVYVYVYK